MMNKHYLMLLLIGLAVGAMISQISERFIIFGVLFVFAGIFFAAKTIDKKQLFTIVLVFAVIIYVDATFFSSATNIAQNSGVIYGNNWWDAMNWIKTNTPLCTTVATYWDPGHFITAIAQRAVIFDGASQNDVISYTTDGENYTVYQRPNENTTTVARIQDIGTSLYTSNETHAMEVLKKYRKPGCQDMYYVASDDLYGKAYWWSYFATWKPENHGQGVNYQTFRRTTSRQVPAQNAVAYTYVSLNDPNQVMVVFDQQGQLRTAAQQGNDFLVVKNTFFVNADGQGIISTQPNSQIDGLAYVFVNRDQLVYMPPEIENSLFTKMFFFNGYGLKNFEFVKDFGGEVKLFKVRFDRGQTFIG